MSTFEQTRAVGNHVYDAFREERVNIFEVASFSHNTSDTSSASELHGAERTRILAEAKNHYYSVSLDNFLEEFFSSTQDAKAQEKELSDVWQTRKENWRKRMLIMEALTQEVEMAMFIGATRQEEFMNFLWEGTGLTFADVHEAPDAKTYDGRNPTTKPALMGVKTADWNSCCRGEGKVKRMCWRHCLLMADAKPVLDPFGPNWSVEVERVLAQLLHYFLELGSIQHRTSSYLILLLPSSPRIIRWSPRQIIYTDLFDFRKGDAFDKFCDFVSRFGSAEATRGLDNHFTRVDPESKDAKDAIKIFQENEDTMKQSGFSVPKVSDLWEFNLPPSSPPKADDPTRLIVGRVGVIRTSLLGRIGKYFVGCNPKEKTRQICFVKVNWGYIGEGRVSESEVYEKLSDSRHVQRMIYGRYARTVDDQSYTLKDSEYVMPSRKAELQTEDKKKRWSLLEKCKGKEREERERDYPDQRLHFLVLPWVRPVSSFRNAYELLEGLHGGLQGLLDMYRAGYLHRDISHSNIALTPLDKGGVKGFLQDFDLAITLDVERTLSNSRTGTYLFLAAALLETPMHAHDLIHDIESCYHVLTTNTFAHWHPDHDLALKLVNEYSQGSARSVKREEISNLYPGLMDADISDIAVLGPVISVFRKFFAARYIDELYLGTLAQNRETSVIWFCSRLGFIGKTSFDESKQQQEELLEFLIQFLHRVIKRQSTVLETMINEGPNEVDNAILANTRRGDALEKVVKKQSKSGQGS
ncbi:hypothetical protein BT69DRAFT_1326563 [Atractiella rhizophila]|nr:hypothetical protein BT69DRAFT_1326563 [Atractiella rhizophila]